MSGRQPQPGAQTCTQPLCSGTGATPFYQQHAQPDFIDVCYASAPPRIEQALADEKELFTRQGLRPRLERLGDLYWAVLIDLPAAGREEWVQNSV